MPLILTLSSLSEELEASLMNPLKETNVAYDVVKYKYSKLRPAELITSLKLILTFEELIERTIGNDDFETINDKKIRDLVSNYLQLNGHLVSMKVQDSFQ